MVAEGEPGMITFTIDGREVETEEGKTILDAALAAGIYIPHLCRHPDLPSLGACRLCVVEVQGRKDPVASCMTPVAAGMRVSTTSERISSARRLAMELMLAGHPVDCSTCNKYLNCELQSLKQYLGCEEIRLRRRTKPFPLVKDNPLFVHDFNRCVGCGRCVRACHELRGVGVLFYKRKDMEGYIGTPRDLPLGEAGCRFCGACAEVCPTGAIMDKPELMEGKSRRHALVPCIHTCPAEIDVPRYIRFIRSKNYSAAAAVVRERVPFPGVLGYVCRRPCEARCRRGQINQPISIRNLKRYAAANDKLLLWKSNRRRKPASGKKIAIVGAGPAGLTAAYYLANQGHSAVVFESMPLAGGMMRYGIPEYRLPRCVLEREIADLQSAGVQIHTNTLISSLDRLFEEGYSAVLLAVGAHKGKKASIPGAQGDHVFASTDFLKQVNLGRTVDLGKKVVVLGGGNVAFDCARVTRRLGAVNILVACVEDRETMPADPEEIQQAEQEGIEVMTSKSCTKILLRNGKCVGVELADVAWFSFDENRNLQLELVENSYHGVEADTVVFAVGQEPAIPEAFDIAVTADNRIEADAYTLSTSKEGVFAAGDAVYGTGSIIEAVASGRKAAVAIDSFLEGDGNIDEVLAPIVVPDCYLGREEGFATAERRNASWVAPELRRSNFDPVVGDMDEEAAYYESGRCLQCDLRLRISAVKTWSSY